MKMCTKQENICHHLICHEWLFFPIVPGGEKLCNKSILTEHIKILLRYVCTLDEAKCTKETKNKGKAWSKFCFKTILKEEQDSSSFFCWSVRGACALQLTCYKQGSSRTDCYSLWEKGREQNMSQAEDGNASLPLM